MFERFTDRARRTIFFARYEASALGGVYIESHHLLLGILREDAMLRLRLSGSAEGLRTEIEKSFKDPSASTSTSADMPISREVRRALEFAEKEAMELKSPVACGQLVLGLLRVKESAAAMMLKKYGIDYRSYRELVRTDPIPAVAPEEQRPARQISRPDVLPYAQSQPAAPSLQATLSRFEQLLDRMVDLFDREGDAAGEQRLKRKPWSRKQAVGHLIDWAAAHQNWIARALTEPNVSTPGYPADDWVSAQRYDEFSWLELVRLWASLNRLLLHVMTGLPEAKLNTMFRIGIERPMALREVIAAYVDHVEDLAGQMLALGS